GVWLGIGWPQPLWDGTVNRRLLCSDLLADLGLFSASQSRTDSTTRILVRQAACNEMVVCDLPHCARRFTSMSPRGTRGTVAALVRLVGPQDVSPAFCEPWHFGTCHRGQ